MDLPRTTRTALLMLAVMPAVAPAQDREPNPLLWQLGGTVWPQALAQSVPLPPLKLSYVDDGEAIEIEVSGHEIELRLDGKPMPAARYTRNGKQVVCRDRLGRPAAELTVNGGVELRALPRRKPRLSLGLSLTPPSEALVAQLGVEADTSIYVAEVAEDGPAARAGVRQHDVIVEIAGAGPATQEHLKDVLDHLQPGETLELTCLRRGERHRVVVKPEAESAGSPWMSVGERAAGLWLRNNPTWVLPQLNANRIQQPVLQSLLPLYGALPELAAPAKQPAAAADHPAGGDELGRRLDALDRRLQRLEALLEKLEGRRPAEVK